MKRWLDAEGVYCLEHHPAMMTAPLTLHLVNLPDVALAPYRLPDQGCDHCQSGLDV